MPYLKITSCRECPYKRMEREHWMEDCFRIFCEHGEQNNTEGFVTKISRQGGIYFNCPLDKPESINCQNCGWEGDRDETVMTDWVDNECSVCPECNELLI